MLSLFVCCGQVLPYITPRRGSDTAALAKTATPCGRVRNTRQHRQGEVLDATNVWKHHTARRGKWIKVHVSRKTGK